MIREVHVNRRVIKAVLRDIRDRPGMGYELFALFEKHGIPLFFIAQSPSRQGKSDLGLVFPEAFFSEVQALEEELEAVGARRVDWDRHAALVNFYAEDGAREVGAAATIFSWFSIAGINVEMTSATADMLSTVIPRNRVDDLVAVIREYTDLPVEFREV